MNQLFRLLALVMGVSFTCCNFPGELVTKDTILKMPLVERGKGFEQRAAYDEALSHVKASRLIEAEHVLDQILESFRRIMSKPGIVYVSLGSVAELEQFKAENKSGREVVWLDWSFREAMQLKAFIAAAKKDFQRALDLLEEQVAIAPYAAGPYTERGYILNMLRRPGDALAAYETGLRLAREFESSKSEEAVALRGIGVTLIELGKLDRAEAVLRESLEVDPGNALALNELKYIERVRRSRSRGVSTDSDPSTPRVAP